MSDFIIKSKNVRIVDITEGNNFEFVKIYKGEDGNREELNRKNGGGNRFPLQNDIAAKIEAAEREAYIRGFTQGKKEGVDEEKAKLLHVSSAFAKAIKDVAKLRKDILNNVEEDMLELVFFIARKLIQQEISTNKNIVKVILKEAMHYVLDREAIKVKLNPGDYRYILESAPDFLDSFEGVNSWTLMEDGNIRPGDVIIETTYGEVDARIEHQLEELMKAACGNK